MTIFEEEAKMGKRTRLADLQLAIMHVLWDRGEATVAEVRDVLQDSRPLAHTTVGTMLAKMEAKGVVKHRVEGRANVYRPAIPRENVSRSMLSDLANRLFAGDVAEMVCQLLADCDVSRDELARLKQLLRDKERGISDDR